MKQILNEVWRPQEFKDVVGISPEIEKMVESGSIPHLLFQGIQGSGKTTSAKIIISKLGAEVLSLNASKERGIDVVRDVIEPFAKKKSDKLKIVFLDEMDAMTPIAMTALRNFMETYAHSTRFIGTCNHINKIIPALQSRFTSFKFGGFTYEDKCIRLQKIIAKEKIEIDEDAVIVLMERYKDDIRSMINFLEQNKNKSITKDDISLESKASVVLSKLIDKKWYEIRQELAKDNIDYEQLLEEMDRTIFLHSKITLDKKRELNMIIAQGMFEMNFSFNKEIAFAAILGKLQGGLQF